MDPPFVKDSEFENMDLGSERVKDAESDNMDSLDALEKYYGYE